jgi:hypothetical protein
MTKLNPYGEDRSILQLEDVNFPLGKAGDLEALDPPRWTDHFSAKA